MAGTGTLRKVKDNKYRLEYMLNKQRYSKTIKADSLAKAKKELACFVAEIEKGTFKNTNYTFYEFSQIWLSECIKPNCSPVTLKRYISYLNNRILPFLGNYKLSDISTIILTSYFNDLKQEKTLYKNRENVPLSKGTIEKIYHIINSILEKAFEFEIINNNPCKKVKLQLNNIESELKKEETIHYYTKEEFKQVIELLKKEKLINRTIIEVALKTGLRRSEIFGLTWDDIDFENKTLKVNKSRHYIKGQGMVTRVPKTKSSYRTISIPNSLIETLKEFKIENSNKEYLFEDKSIDGICSWFKNFQKRNNINIIRFHDLRHTHATLLLAQGVDLKTISERLGHSTIARTMNTYTHVLKELDLNASNLIDSL